MIRILIVEDEYILRKGIISLIDWNQLNCEISGEAPNGTEAVNFLKENKVDLVITDIKMPGLNGLELAKHISENHPQTGVILLSAYSDFEYAQQAIDLGIFKYVLKSNFVKDLPKAVKDSIEKINSIKDAPNEHVNPTRNDTLMRPIVVKSMLDGSLNDAEEISEWFACYNIHLKYYFIVIAEIDSTEQNSFTKTQEKIDHSVQNFFDLSFKDYSHLCVLLNDNLLFILINFDDSNEVSNLRSVVIVCNQILSTVKNYMLFDLNIGVSAQHLRPAEIKQSGEEAKYALNHTFQYNGIALYKDIIKQKSIDSPQSGQKYADLILNDISDHNEQSLTIHLQEFFNCYINSINDLENFKIEVLLLLSTCFRKLTDNNIHISCNDSLYRKTSAQIIQCQTLNMIYKIMEGAFQDVIRVDISTPTHYNRFVAQVDHFIKENYSLPIKLDDMAKLFHVNSSYLSRLYKKETGDSIITALNKYRIEKAKELLKSGDYLISEVGYLVGIGDPAYFTNVFNKYAGTSPQNYRSITERGTSYESSERVHI